FFLFRHPQPPSSTLFPYTTLFRSEAAQTGKTARKEAARFSPCRLCRPCRPCRLVLRRRRVHAHAIPLLVLVLELDLPVDHREQRVVRGAAHVEAGVELRSPLLHEDAPRGHEFPGEPLHAQVLRTRIAPVAGGADTLLVSHVDQSLSLTSAILISVNCCRCPAWRRNPVRRANR